MLAYDYPLLGAFWTMLIFFIWIAVDAWAGDDPAGRPPLVLSDYDGVNAPPTLFDRALFEDLLALPDDRCPRRLARLHHDRAATCRWPAGALADLDRPEDVAAAGAATLPPG
jgi:CTP:molybdopterin cytidylyltransferase MocA